MMGKGIFITFEGSEGSGKSTQSKMLCRFLESRGYPMLHLREPGSTKIGERIRQILLDRKNNSLSAVTEMLLYMAARSQMVEEIVRGALKRGKIVICDRFLDSTLAYQGYGLGIDVAAIRYIGKIATQGIKPDLTIFMDLPVERGLKVCGRTKDRIEKRPLSYHARVRRGYLTLAGDEPKRIKIVKVEKDKSLTQKKIRKIVAEILKVE